MNRARRRARSAPTGRTLYAPGQHGHGTAGTESGRRLTMDARTRNAFLVVVALVVGIAAATAFLFGGTASGDPSGASGAPPDAQHVVGVVTSVDSSGLTNVTGFGLRTADGTTMTFSLDALENAVEFPPGHLVEHQASASRIRVWFRTDGGVDRAVRLEDAE